MKNYISYGAKSHLEGGQVLNVLFKVKHVPLSILVHLFNKMECLWFRVVNTSSSYLHITHSSEHFPYFWILRALVQFFIQCHSLLKDMWLLHSGLHLRLLVLGLSWSLVEQLRILSVRSDYRRLEKRMQLGVSRNIEGVISKVFTSLIHMSFRRFA